jgi:serine/threonine-protein kinase
MTDRQTGRDDHWGEALAVFDTLSELEPGERAVALECLRRENPSLHDRVASLLRADDEATAGGFMAGSAVSDVVGEHPVAAAGVPKAAECVGPWRLERSLGVGGMGRVWLARRHDGLYEGRVAIKMLREMVADDHAAARFAREGELLARLNHPNIARLLDAGTLADGQRYLVLEYIRGERIDQYCDRLQLGIAARVTLFLQVCAAVAHAHANLIVHRDLKPANILVEGDGQVKLLDFGVAKLIEGETGGEESPLTHVAGAGWTPEYAAPEQIEGGAITTATDVYSLGVVLYRLLSGERPFGDRTSSSASMARDIVEAEIRPLSATTGSATAADVAALRGLTPARLRRALEGDLENIVAYALKKKPAERYASARALMLDLEAYLDSRPVVARPDSLGYRAQKFIRRHKVGVAAAASLVMATLVGVAGIIWQARIAVEQKTEAERQAKLAMAESEKANAVKQFMIDLFRANLAGSSDIEQAQQLTARKLLDTGSERIASQFATQPELRVELLDIVGELYFRLGEHDRARQLTQERIALLEQSPTETRDQRMNSYGNLGTLAWRIGDTAGAREAARELEALIAGTPAVPVTNQNLLIRKARPDLYADPGKAVAVAASALQEHVRIDHVAPITSYDLAALEVVTRGQVQLGRNDLALTAAEASLDMARRFTGDDHFNAGVAEALLGEVDMAAYRFADAREHLQAALATARRTQGRTHPHTLLIQAHLGAVLHRGGKRGEGLGLLERALALHAKSLSRNAIDDLRMRLLLSEAYWDEGRFAEAGEVLNAAVVELRNKPDLKLLLGQALLLRAQWDGAGGRGDDAIADAAEARAIFVDALGDKSPRLADALVVLADELRQSGDGGRAREALDRARGLPVDAGRAFPASQLQQTLQRAELQLWRGEFDNAMESFRNVAEQVEGSGERAFHRSLIARARLGFGRAATVSGNWKEARVALTEAVDLRTALGPADSPWLAEARVALADCLLQMGDPAGAARLIAEAEAAYARRPAPGRRFTYPLKKIAALLATAE